MADIDVTLLDVGTDPLQRRPETIMSVDTRRLAAAQRTAALRSLSTSRSKRLGAWIIIVPALSLFSFSLVAGAAGFGAKPDLAAAAAKVVPKQQADDGKVVVVESSKHDGNPLASAFGNTVGHEVCWVSATQLTRVSAVYRTTSTTVTVGHTAYGIVTVYGANERDLKRVLGGPATLKCRLVHAVGLFFLPFDPNGS